MTDGRYIAGVLPESAILEQLAEEASELAHASLKLARILRGSGQPDACRVVVPRGMTIEDQ